MIWIGAALAASVTLNPGDDVGALTSALGPGDEIVFANGIYEIPETVTWSGLGTADKPIVLRANEPGMAVLEFVGESGRVARVADATHLTIDGLVFQGSADWELLSQGGVEIHDSTDVTLTGVELTRLGSTAVVLSGDNARVSMVDSHIHELLSNAFYVGCGDASCWSSGVTLQGNLVHGLRGTSSYLVLLEAGSQGVQIVDNVFYDLAYRGILTQSTELGDPNVVEGNAMWSVTDIAMYLRGSVTVRNNVVFNCGTGLYLSDPGWDTYSDMVISHNTIVDTTGWGIDLHSWAGQEGMVLANNVVSNPTGYAFDGEDGSHVDDGNYISSNVFTGLVRGLEPLKGHYVAGAGGRDFTDAEGWDFYPSQTSTLLGAADPAGDAWVPEIDFNHADRDGAAPDVGAYERVAPENPGWPIQEGFKQPGVDLGGDEGEEVGGCRNKDANASLALLPLLLLARRRSRSRSRGLPTR